MPEIGDSSSLSRLFALVECSESLNTRKIAAEQVALFVSNYPTYLDAVLDKCQILLFNKNWDTRLAAGYALGAIARRVPKWHAVVSEQPTSLMPSQPQSPAISEDSIVDAASKLKDHYTLTFDGFNIEDIFNNGVRLLGSSGKEYDIYFDPKDAKRLLAEQRRVLQADLRQRLGIRGDAPSFGERDADEGIADEDLVLPTKSDAQATAAAAAQLKDFLSKVEGAKYSARERNTLKRQFKQRVAREHNTPLGGSMFRTQSILGPDDVKKEKKHHQNADIVDNTKDVEMTSLRDHWSSDGQFVWPFMTVCDIFLHSMFDEKWEVRHGALVGLREIMKSQVSSAGRGSCLKVPVLSPQNSLILSDLENEAWISDCVIRCICVLALDRFGDFTMDTLAAPVRETAGQVIGALLAKASNQVLWSVFNIFRTPGMVSSKDWEVRQSSLIGLKYLFAVRKEWLFSEGIQKRVFEEVIPTVAKSLLDGDDDIRAVAAECLTPIINDILTFPGATDVVRDLISTLWNALCRLDTVSASTTPILTLLKSCYDNSTDQEVFRTAEKLAASQVAPKTQCSPLSVLIPLLLPFLYHPSSAMRLATVQLLRILSLHIQSRGGMDAYTMSHVMRHLLQSLCFEPDEQIVNAAIVSWDTLLWVSKACSILSESLACTLHDSVVKHPLRSQLSYYMDLLYDETRTPSTLTDALFSFLLQVEADTVDTVMFALPELGELGTKKTTSDKNKDQLASNNMAPLQLLMSKYVFADMESAARSRWMFSLIVATLIRYLPVNDQLVVNSFLVSLLQQISSVSQTAASMVYYLVIVDQLLTKADQTPSEYAPRGLIKIAESQISSSLRPTMPYAITSLSVLKSVPASIIKIVNDAVIRSLSLTEQWSPERIAEVVISLNSLQSICSTFLNGCVIDGLPQPPMPPPPAHLITQAQALSDWNLIPIIAQLPAFADLPPLIRKSASDLILGRQFKVTEALNQVKLLVMTHTSRSQTSLAMSLLWSCALPSSFSTVVRPLMNTLKSDMSHSWQLLASQAVVRLLLVAPALDKVGAASKLLSNSILYVCSGRPTFAAEFKRQITMDAENNGPIVVPSYETLVCQNGGELVVNTLFSVFGDTTFDEFPKLGDAFVQCLNVNDVSLLNCMDEVKWNSFMDCLRLICRCCSHATDALFIKYLHPVIKTISWLCMSDMCILSTCALETLTALAMCSHSRSAVMVNVMEYVVPKMKLPSVEWERSAAISIVDTLVSRLKADVIPYALLFLLPLLGTLSDPSPHVRNHSASSLACIVRVLPVESAIPDPPGLPASYNKVRSDCRCFVRQLLGQESVKPVKIEPGESDPQDDLMIKAEHEKSAYDETFRGTSTTERYEACPINQLKLNGELRHYQMEGLNWLWFLYRFNLNGILCDDMGLGKTLQTLCIIALSHVHQRQGYSGFEWSLSVKQEDAVRQHMPSLVVCPPTVVDHWVEEAMQFLPKDISVTKYAGSASHRRSVFDMLTSHDLIITSYETVRSDVTQLSTINWNYIVLDEGHIIRNPTTKMAQSVKMLQSSHRLILSGTPIQNSAAELWALFDFLMPGLLGSQRDFNAHFMSRITASKDPKVADEIRESGIQAMLEIHRVVLPFVLRRMKEDVLSDLPPKIVQDVVVPLSDLQVTLYEACGREVKSTGAGDECVTETKSTHVFEALQYLRRLCVHPVLVLKNPDIQHLINPGDPTDVHDLKYAPKLQALKEILEECGLGTPEEAAHPAHRVLVFAQFKSVLDLVEKDLFSKHMKHITSLRLDGGVEAGARQSIVTRFNNDTSVHVLLLTTKIGGLGLTLVGADVVVFLEHDWNPMMDLQAMDRAHRIGQKKTVNVYRILTKDTLETKIMSLQQFKTKVANTVVGSDNASIKTMQSDRLLDLFAVAPSKDKPEQSVDDGLNTMGEIEDKRRKKKKTGLGQLMDELGDLWQENQYQEDWNVERFASSINS